MKISHRMDHDKIDWSSFRYMVFDTPSSKGSYSERYSYLCTTIFFHSLFFLLLINLVLPKGDALKGKNHRYVSVAPYEVCKDTAHVEKSFQDIMDQGGEGVILRDPSSPYQAGRSSGFLKHKVSGLKRTSSNKKITPIHRNTETQRRELLSR